MSKRIIPLVVVAVLVVGLLGYWIFGRQRGHDAHRSAGQCRPAPGGAALQRQRAHRRSAGGRRHHGEGRPGAGATRYRPTAAARGAGRSSRRRATRGAEETSQWRASRGNCSSPGGAGSGAGRGRECHEPIATSAQYQRRIERTCDQPARPRSRHRGGTHERSSGRELAQGTRADASPALARKKSIKRKRNSMRPKPISRCSSDNWPMRN